MRPTLLKYLHADVGSACLLLVGLASISFYVWIFYQPQPEQLAVKLFLLALYLLSMVALIMIGETIDSLKSEEENGRNS